MKSSSDFFLPSFINQSPVFPGFWLFLILLFLVAKRSTCKKFENKMNQDLECMAQEQQQPSIHSILHGFKPSVNLRVSCEVKDGPWLSSPCSPPRAVLTRGVLVPSHHPHHGHSENCTHPTAPLWLPKRTSSEHSQA